MGLFKHGLLSVDDIDTLAGILDAYTLEVVDDILARRRPFDILDTSGACHVSLWAEAAMGVGGTDSQSVEAWVDINIIRRLLCNRDELVILE